MATDAAAIEHRSYARVGLLGNPSDVYFGRTIAFSLGNFWASVRLEPSEDLVIRPHPSHDLVSFASIHNMIRGSIETLCVVPGGDNIARAKILPVDGNIDNAGVWALMTPTSGASNSVRFYKVNRLQNEGYYGGVRLLMAICKVFYKFCGENKIELKDENFTLSYDTNIPRQTGLSGSSAIVCAALNCLLDFYKVRHLVPVDIRPGLILSAEKELGIVAGLQDRVAQVYGGLVYMDFSKEHMDNLGHGIYTPMDVSLLPPLHIIYAENPSDSGKVHSTVQKRWLDGDEFIISSMEKVANVALEGRSALLENNYSELAKLMNLNFDLRRSMFGDAALGSLNIKMIEVTRGVGAAAKFTGSGGAVVAFCPDGPDQVKLLEDACEKEGLILQPAVVIPPLLKEEDFQTLSS